MKCTMNSLGNSKDKSIAKFKYFAKIWKQYFPELKEVKHKNPLLGLCDYCFEFNNSLVEYLPNSEQYELIKKSKQEHITKTFIEREQYHDRRIVAQSLSESFMRMIAYSPEDVFIPMGSQFP